MAYINIAQPDGNARHVRVTVGITKVWFSTENDQFMMDYYDATELARMLMAAANKL